MPGPSADLAVQFRPHFGAFRESAFKRGTIGLNDAPLGDQPGDEPRRDSPGYRVALLTLELSSAVATADGSFGAAESNHQHLADLGADIIGWDY